MEYIKPERIMLKEHPELDERWVQERIAEDITGRFLNVISLFNGFIPLIAIQMGAFQVDEHLALIFTKVLDELPLGLVEEDEEVQQAVDRTYWEDKGTKGTVAMADELLEIIRTLDPGLEMKYNKYYIGLAKNGRANNFVVFKPKKNNLRLEIRLERSEELEQRLDEAGLDVMEYDRRSGRYRIRLVKPDIEKHQELLAELLRLAYERSSV